MIYIHCIIYSALISSQLELHRLATNRQPRVVAALTMLKQMLFRYQGHVSAALILGGVDITGPHLHTVYPHGSTDKLPYVAMGSGSLAAMAVLEKGYKKDLTVSPCFVFQFLIYFNFFYLLSSRNKKLSLLLRTPSELVSSTILVLVVM